MRQYLIPTFAMIIFLLFWRLWSGSTTGRTIRWPHRPICGQHLAVQGAVPLVWLETLWRTVVGLLIAIVIGVFLGMIMGFSKVMREGLYPLLVGFNAIPKATVVPIVALMFVGQHDLNTILIAFMISFFPIAVSVSIGLSTLEPEYRDILRSLGASKITIFWKIALPKTLPEFFGAPWVTC